jgi:hypothetical protein
VVQVNVSKDYTQPPWIATRLSILAGSTDLAALLGLSRPSVVTNWRSRYTDFPAPKSSGNPPLYDVVEVMDWLRHSDSRLRDVPVISAERWWGAVVGAFQAQSGVESARSSMAALLLLHRALHREFGATGAERWRAVASMPEITGPRETGDPERVTRELMTAAAWAEEHRREYVGLLTEPLRLGGRAADGLCDLVRALQWCFSVVGAEAAPSSRDGVEREPYAALLDAVLAAGADGRPLPARATGRSLASLMAALAGVSTDCTVLDPAAGEASLLVAAARRTGPGGRLLGQELDRSTWQIARAVLAIRDIDADLGSPGLSSITDDQHVGVRADAVLIDPPVGHGAPPIDLWIDHGMPHLAESGRLVIAVPMGELVEVRSSRRTANQRLVGYVQQLARDHRVEAVLAVPRGVRRDVVGPIALFVIDPRRTDVPQIDVGVIDHLPDSIDDAPMSDDDLDVVADEMVATLRGSARTEHTRGSELVVASRISAGQLFEFLAAFAERLDRRTVKGPRSDRMLWASNPRALSRSAPPDTVELRALSSMADDDDDAVRLAMRLVDALERDRHSLNDKQVMALLQTAERITELLRPLRRF